MASIKRKAVADELPNKKVKASNRDRPKHSKDDPPASKPARPAKTGKEDSGRRKPTQTSILLQEDKVFPRGGASVLTPLEQKQIRAQAEQDALLEHETAQAETGDLFDGPTDTLSTKRRTKQRKDEVVHPRVESSGVKISGLSFKSLVVGSVILGRVMAVTAKDIALALPNNLTGYVPLTAVSDRLNARIERVLDDATSQIAQDESEDVRLQSMFARGQWLRAVVTANGSDSTEPSGKSKRHIELSLDPRMVNQGLDADNTVAGSMLQAAVSSVEDHGVILDLGFGDGSVKGFVSKKELGTAYTLEELQDGQVVLGLVTGKASNGRVLNLSLNPARYSTSDTEQTSVLNEAPTVECFLSGTAVTLLITESGPGGVVGKVMGMLDVTADVVHSGGYADAESVSKRFKIGSKTKGRIIWTIPKDDGSRSIGVSFLPQILALVPEFSKIPKNATAKLKLLARQLEQELPLSSIVENAKVTRVIPERGLFLSLSNSTGQADASISAFAHISQISDSRIDTLSTTSGPYAPDSAQTVRIVSYDPVDNIYYVSLKPSTLEQAFLRLDDVTVGQRVEGTIERLILGGKTGVTGVLVKLSDAVTGLVPEMHFSDTQLQHPERKFREGNAVRARVLSIDLEKRQLRLTLKKSLVDSLQEHTIWQSYQNLKSGMESQGTVINLLPKGAVVQFFGALRAWLPLSEMSEAYTKTPDEVLRLGQTVHVRILSVDAEAQEMKVSRREERSIEPEQQETWDRIQGGDMVTGVISEKAAESITVVLEDGQRGMIRHGHLVDGSAAKAESAAKRLRVGQTLANLLVLRKFERSRTVLLTNKPAMIEDVTSGLVIKSFADVKNGRKVHGFVRNITPESVFVEFVNEMVGLIPKSQILPEALELPDFGLRNDQTVGVWVSHLDMDKERFSLTFREQTIARLSVDKPIAEDVLDPVDTSILSTTDFSIGKVTKARIASVKATQINVRLADGIQGRIDISEAFDTWEEISNKTAPLQKFQPNEIIEVKILGLHDARNHRFLPISHRQGKASVYELSAKRSRIDSGSDALLNLRTVQLGSTYPAFINNHGDNCVWASLSPNVRGRVALMDLSDDVGSLQTVEKHFRIGRALHVKVKAVDLVANRLDLVANHDGQSAALTLTDLTAGMTIPARVTKVTARSVIVQLADDLVGAVPLVEMSDDFDQVDPSKYSKNDIVRVCVLGTDIPNKKVFLSLRPSRVLSSSLPVKDPLINDISQLKVGDLIRGFVKHVAEKGVFVSLSAQMDARIWITDLSDAYIKDWKSIVEIDQLVKGRIISVDTTSKDVRISIKSSHVDPNYKQPLKLDHLKAGQVVTGKVRKVEDFGAFIDIDNTVPRLSGLCHRSEVADKPVADVRKLYSEGDKVKAKVLNVDIGNRRISLGLKAKYFQQDLDDDDEDEAGDDEVGGVEIVPHADDNDDDDDDEEMDGGIDVDGASDIDMEPGLSPRNHTVAMKEASVQVSGAGLATSGFDWTGDSMNLNKDAIAADSEAERSAIKKRKRNKAEIKVDMTGDLDKYGPRNVSDFERQLLGQPNNSGLWIQYMAFQLQLGETQQARDIAERALRTIHIRETEEKANVWIAWLNLEVEYGDEERVEEVFKQACQVQDSLEMHEKLASIYIDSGKNDKADAVFERIVANKNFRASPAVWVNHASFLMDKMHSPDRAHTVLPRALQSVPMYEQRPLTAKFAALEFKSAQGDPERGRTIFQGLLSEWPKWHGGWDMWTDLEQSRISHVEGSEAKQDAREKARSLYEQMAAQKMKKRRAKFLFKKWLEFEERQGSERDVERVKALAEDYVSKAQAKGGDDGDDE